MSVGAAFQIIGGVVGGPWGMAIAIAGSAIDYAMSDATQVGKLDDKNMLVSSNGTIIPKFWGTVRVAGIVIWCTELEEVVNKSKGKGGGGKVDNYEYRANLAIAVNDNKSVCFLDIIQDSKDKVYTTNNKASMKSLVASQDYSEALRFYYADTNQLPDPFIQSIEGINRTSAYKDYTYVVIQGLTTKVPYAPNLEFIVATNATKTYISNVLLTESQGTTHIYTAIDFNNFICYLSRSLGYSFYKYNTSGSKSYHTEIDLSDKIYYDYDLGPFLLQNFSIGRTHKTMNSVITATGEAKGYTFFFEINGSGMATYPAYTNRKIKGRVSNLMTLSKLGSRYEYYSLDNKYYLNGLEFSTYIRDFDCTLNNFYINTGKRILKYDSIRNAPEVLFDDLTSVEGINGSIKQVCAVNDDLIYFTRRTGSLPSRLELYKIENNQVNFVREMLDAGFGTANHMIAENTDSLLFIQNDGYGGGNNGVKINTVSWEPAPVKLSDIVIDIIKIAKEGNDEFLEDVVLEDVDCKDLEDILVHGYSLDRDVTAKEALQTLADCYFFEAKASGTSLVFVKRGKQPYVKIPSAHFCGDLNGERNQDLISITKKHDRELPYEVRVNHLDRTADYKLNSQYARRQVTNSRDVKTYDVRISMSPDEARTVASKILDSFWKSRYEYQFNLPYMYSYIEPCDVIEIEFEGVYHIVRIIKVHKQSGIIKITAVSEDPAIYTKREVGATIKSDLGIEVDMVVPTNFQILDIPLLRDQDKNIGVYIASGPFIDYKWSGCSLSRSTDKGSSYNALKSFSKRAMMGTTLTKLQNFHSSMLLDTSSYVDVKTNNATDLISATYENIVNDKDLNLALIGNEIVQFMYAEGIDENTYRLFGLIRGCRGTDHEMNNHKIDERFIHLDEKTLDVLGISSNEFDLDYSYKATTFGSYIGKTDEFQFIYEGKAFECYSPVQIGGGFHENGATLKWTRRAKLNNFWNNFVDVPLDEVEEKYEIEILKNGNVIRTIQVNTTTLEYTNAQIIEDFGSLQNKLNFNVYQISSLRGKGFKGLGKI